ncbi:MAG: hypothetical protein COU33_01310 [Candidatus Magasanikbacteria bacterium CG10_big_fil_rev_8_21_14_0_10_43_6]|uniref:Uncharacterized protein n=1 Tax=Candidatus Magasanikbacteria bacterium CG10_big_fil_rev_8_21_14_0_10_43_6 TaxID=1974650 RepID=A0A2M6W1V9_9BACT|nr:MAG: hypothetical protein COU33_01310 [Candidatus Magasanikbacteria bacterium CG10_big_fil_rev_8_21_14_0_10_43_6]
MSVTNSQPTILVKKSDGTSVRMTLDELQAYKAAQKQPPSVSQNPVEPEPVRDAYPPLVIPREDMSGALPHDEELTFSLDADDLPGAHIDDVDAFPSENSEVEQTVVLDADDLVGATETVTHDPVTEEGANTPVVATSVALSSTTPVVDVFVDAAMAQEQHILPAESRVDSSDMVQWESDDHRSLLDDTLAVDDTAHTPTTDHKQARVEHIIASLDASILAGKEERVRSLILSRIKDVRNDDQVRAYVVRPVDKGGLGMEPDMAEALVAAIHGDTTPPPPQPVLDEPMPVEEATPNMLEQMTSLVPPLQKEEPTRQSFGAKPVLHDIRPAAAQPRPIPSPLLTAEVAPASLSKTTMGPVDEFRTIDLASFRRIASDPAEVIQKLIQKSEVLKKDSYTLFMQAQAAWFQSPLYRQYQQVLADALQTRRPLASAIGTGADALTLGEVEQIIMLNKKLS